MEGVELVNAGGESCSACDRPAVGRSLAGHLLCARHAGWAAQLAEELEQERQESAQRVNARRAETLERCRRRIAIDENVKGDNERRARGARAAQARKNNRAADAPISPRAEYDRARYLANRQAKIQQVIEAQRRRKAPERPAVRLYRSGDE